LLESADQAASGGGGDFDPKVLRQNAESRNRVEAQMNFCEAPANCPYESVGVANCPSVQVPISELFRVVEIAEPALLLCKATMGRIGRDPVQVKAIEKELNRVRALKAELMAIPQFGSDRG
jgi:hypothetical protein